VTACSVFLVQLERDIISGVYFQRYEKRLEQQKGIPNLNACDVEENLEEYL